MQARLKVVQDNANLKQVKLLPITVIGRGAECHLKIASTQVSRKHCRITVTDNEVLIEDLTSSNGTFVDQEKIPSGKPIVVAPGAKLQVGPATFIVDYTPPVNLETMPTTVIKASELPALQEMAIPLSKPMPVSEASIPTIDPFAAAVADGSAPAGVITPNPAPEAPTPVAPESSASEETVQMPAAALSATNAAAEAMAWQDSTITQQAPPAAPQAAEPPAIVPAPVVAPVIAAPAIQVVEQPALIPAVVVSAPPLVAAAVAPVSPMVAAPVPVAVVPAATVVPALPAAPPVVAAAASDFDFLGGAATAAVEQNTFNAFQFEVAAPAPAAAPIPAPIASESAAKSTAAKKPLFGLFGKKEKGAAPSTSAPAAAPVVTAPPAAAPSAQSDPFSFAPPVAPAPAVAPPAAEPAAAPPADDPFAFLR